MKDKENTSYLKSSNENEKQISISKNSFKKSTVPKKKSAKINKEIKYKSHDEIREAYGKLEIVSLYNGREFTGAVISINEMYTMVTLEGIVSIPMGDVKSRVIIK